MLGEKHPDVATSLSGLANLYSSQGHYEQAEPLCRQALELRKQMLGEKHPDVATSLNILANIYYSQGRYEEAEQLYKQASVDHKVFSRSAITGIFVVCDTFSWSPLKSLDSTVFPS